MGNIREAFLDIKGLIVVRVAVAIIALVDSVFSVLDRQDDIAKKEEYPDFQEVT